MKKRYRVMNRITKEWSEGEAESAQAACTQAGWLIGDCWVREYSPKGSGGWKVPEELRAKQASEPEGSTRNASAEARPEARAAEERHASLPKLRKRRGYGACRVCQRWSREEGVEVPGL